MSAICAGRRGLASCPIRNGRIPYSRYLGEPGPDGYNLEQFSVGYAFEHRFDNNLQFRSEPALHSTSATISLRVRSEGMLIRDLPGSRAYASLQLCEGQRRQNIALDNQLQADFATGPLLHKVLAGFDYFNRQDSTPNYQVRGHRPDRRVCAGLRRPRSAGQYACPLHRYARPGEAGRYLPAGSGQARSLDAHAHGTAGLGAGGYDQQGVLSARRAPICRMTRRRPAASA